MAGRDRLQFSETERRFESGGRIDKKKVKRRRQEKKSRGIIKEAARGTESRDRADRGEVLRDRAGGTGIKGERDQEGRKKTGAARTKHGRFRFEESRPKSPSKLVHRADVMAENAALNIYQRAKAANRQNRETETSEKITDRMEQGADTAILTGRQLRFLKEARSEYRAFSDPEKVTETEGRLRFEATAKKGSGTRRPVSKGKTRTRLSASAREEMRLMYEVDRLKHPWAYDSKTSAIQQKRAIRKRYAAKLRAKKQRERAAAAVIKTARAAEKAAEDSTKAAAFFFVRHPIIGILLLIIAVIVILILLGSGSCHMITGGVSSGVAATTYPTPDKELLLAEGIYSQMEKDLQFELDNYQDLHPNYDEYHFDLDEIGHDPYVLVTLLSAKKKGEWTAEEMRPVMEEMFKKEYILTEDVTVETRTREVEKTDPDTGEIVTEEETYEYRIINVTLENRDLSRQTEDLTREEKGLYAAYIGTHGNRPDLFDPSAYPNAVPRELPEKYEIPPEALSDERFALMIEVAEKYLGYPYVWGGSSPVTSFDCSGFVSWVLNHSGFSVGRRTANELMSVTVPVEPGVAKPGDLIFFQKTYRTNGASHVGIYVGNGVMIHCGDPISYTSINTPYWQSHFLRFGRLY